MPESGDEVEKRRKRRKRMPESGRKMGKRRTGRKRRKRML